MRVALVVVMFSRGGVLRLGLLLFVSYHRDYGGNLRAVWALHLYRSGPYVSAQRVVPGTSQHTTSITCTIPYPTTTGNADLEPRAEPWPYRWYFRIRFI